MGNGQVHWDRQRVSLVLKNATQEAIEAVAYELERQAKINIEDNHQVDTGFMVNSVHTITPASSGWAAAKAVAEARTYSHKRQAHVDHTGDMAPQATLPARASAAVVVGAIYAVHQEVKQSFLYKALEQIAKDAGGIIQRMARSKLK